MSGLPASLAPYYLQPYKTNAGTYYWIAYGETDIAVYSSSWIDVTRQVVGTLDGGINDAVATISLVDASAFPTSGTIALGSQAITDGDSDAYEEIDYSGKSSNDLTGCSRGANSTTAAPHTTGSIVTPIETTATGATVGKLYYYCPNHSGMGAEGNLSLYPSAGSGSGTAFDQLLLIGA